MVTRGKAHLRLIIRVEVHVWGFEVDRHNVQVEKEVGIILKDDLVGAAQLSGFILLAA